jgi:serine/threonine protein kinase
MTETPSTTNDAQTRAPSEPVAPVTRTCPACHAVYSEQIIAKANYLCSKCGLEMAFIENGVNNTPPKVLAWLHQAGDIVLGRYRVDHILAKGGFATTYQVSDLHVNNRKRALKEIPKSLYNKVEEEILSHLDHPAIPDIVDRGESQDAVDLVLKFGGGRTLEDERRDRGGRIPLNVALPWIQQLADVVDYLHGQTPAIIHRDLKPDNVLLDEQGHIMLIDFGIAKWSSANTRTSTIARAATHGYSPPEQTLGTGTDLRSDVYSLAATLYTLLTGQVPPPAHVRVAGRELTPPAELVPELPKPVSDALIDALKLNINERPQSISALMERLNAAAPQQATAPTLMLNHPFSSLDRSSAKVRIGDQPAVLTSPTASGHDAKKGIWILVTALFAVVAGASLFTVHEYYSASPPQPPSHPDNSLGNIGSIDGDNSKPPDDEKTTDPKDLDSDSNTSNPDKSLDFEGDKGPGSSDAAMSPPFTDFFLSIRPTPTYRLGTGYPTPLMPTYRPQGYLPPADWAPTIFTSDNTVPRSLDKGPGLVTNDKSSPVETAVAHDINTGTSRSTVGKRSGPSTGYRPTPAYRMGTGRPISPTRPYRPQGHLTLPRWPLPLVNRK